MLRRLYQIHKIMCVCYALHININLKTCKIFQKLTIHFGHSITNNSRSNNICWYKTKLCSYYRKRDSDIKTIIVKNHCVFNVKKIYFVMYNLQN